MVAFVLVAVEAVINSEICKYLDLKYQSIDIRGTDVHLCSLKNSQQFSDKDGKAEQLGISSALWPLFGTIWDSSIILANHIASIDFSNKKILEVGCGLALTSHFLQLKGADITATDYHPEVIKFLEANSRLNRIKIIPFVQTNWDDLDSELGCFNLIIGSDIMYMQEHPEKLAKFMDKHADSNSTVIVVDPGRHYINLFTKNMHLYEFKHENIIPKDVKDLSKPFNGLIHYYTRF